VGQYKSPIRVSIDTSQVDHLVKRLIELDKKAARAAMKKGVNEVTKLVLKEAKALVPQRTGALKKSLGRFVKVTKDGRAVFGIVKPRAGVWMADAPGLVGRRVTRRGKTRVFVQKFRTMFQGKPVNPVYYAHLVEYGRVAVSVKKKKVLSSGKEGGAIYGTHVSAAAPRPFMRPAWDKYKDRAPEIMARFLREALKKVWTSGRAGGSRGRGR
jgi:HK97 gp10 family phage protein